MAPHRRWGALHTSPGADAAAPADDGVEHAGVVLDLGVFENDRLFDSGSCPDHGARANGDIGSQLRRWVDRRGGVDVDWRHNGRRRGSEFLRLRLERFLEVEGVGGHGRASGLDLPPEVLGLVDEESVAVGEIGEDVLLQAQHLWLLSILLLLLCHKRRLEILRRRVGDQAGASGAPLDRATDGREDALCRKQVDTAVDQVRDVGLRLLDIVQNTLGVRIGHNATKVGRSLIADSRSQDNGLRILLLEQLQHLTEGERATHVGIEHEEALRFALKDGITEMVQTASGAQCLVLS